MTVSTFYSETVDGYLTSSNVTYATARSGSNLTASTTATTAIIGQYNNGGKTLVNYIYETFLSYDTSSIPNGDNITEADFSLYVTSDLTTNDFTSQARTYDWGTSLTTADWIPGSDLPSDTLLAQDATSGLTTSAYNEYTDYNSNLESAINKTGDTRFSVTSSDTANGFAPATGTTEYFIVSTADSSGTSQDPKLVVTHTGDVSVNATGVSATGSVGTAYWPGVLKMDVVTVDCNTSTGNQTITGDLEGHVCQAAIFVYSKSTTQNGTFNSDAMLSLGMAHGSTYAGKISFIDGDALGTSDGYATESNAGGIEERSESGSSLASATIVSMAEDSVTIDWTNAPSGAYKLMVIMFGGTAIEEVGAKTNMDLPTSASGTLAVTGVGFKPNMLFAISFMEGGTAASAEGKIVMGMGIDSSLDGWTSDYTGNSASIAMAADWDVTTMNNSGWTAEGFMGSFDASSGSKEGIFDIQSWDSDGITVIETDGSTPGASHDPQVLFLKLDSSAYNAHLTNWSPPTSTGESTITTANTTPQAGIMLANPSTVFDTPAGDSAFGIGAWANANSSIHTASYSIASEDGVTTSVAKTVGDNMFMRMADEDSAAATSWTANIANVNVGSYDLLISDAAPEVGQDTIILTMGPVSGDVTLNVTGVSSIGSTSPQGQNVFSVVGSNTFTVPTGVTTIAAVAVGGGGSGSTDLASGAEGGGGGGGAALAYSNSISVTPGETLDINIGAGGAAVTAADTDGNDGGNSNIKRAAATLLEAVGGDGGIRGDGNFGLGGLASASTGDTKFDGGDGGWGGSSESGGGGGAAGYSGAGADGTDSDVTGDGADGTGGSGGSGGNGNSNNPAGGGGGVGLEVEGSNGVGGDRPAGTGIGTGASGGSQGSNGVDGTSSDAGDGGQYGGGGGATSDDGDENSGAGGDGGIRIIWGDGRSYPSNSADVTPSDGTTSIGTVTIALGKTVNATGVAATGSINSVTPNFDYQHTVTGEESSVPTPGLNNFRYSYEFDNAYWSKDKAVVTPDYATDARGDTSAYRFIDDNLGGNDGVRLIRTPSAPESGTFTVSLEAKADQLDWLVIQVAGAPWSSFASYDLTNGVIGGMTTPSNPVSHDIASLGSGWYLCSFTFTLTSILGATIRFFVAEGDYSVDWNNSNVDRDGTSSILIGRSQYNRGSEVKPYIDTTSTEIDSEAKVNNDFSIVSTGVAGTGSIGSVSIETGWSESVTGLSGSSSLGSPTISSEANISVIGVSSTGSLGVATTTAGASVSITGVTGTGQIGTVSIDTSTSINVNVTGVSGTSSVGSTTTLFDWSQTVTGVSASASISSVNTYYDFQVSSSGISGTAQLGSATVSINQIMVPDGDVTDGSWTNESGNNTNLYDSINEPNTPNDSDYIQSGSTPSSDLVEISLSNPSGTPDADTGHILRYRYRKQANSGTINITVKLMMGATEIASWTHNNITNSYVDGEQTLTTLQASNITNYNDLRIQITADEV